MSNKFVMYPHGGSGNHGCEAIVRTTINLLGNNNEFLLFSDDADEDKKYIEDAHFPILQPRVEIKRHSFRYLKAALKYHLLDDLDAYDALTFDPIISRLSTGTILLSIGGDNYCYGDNDHIYLVNRYAKKKGCKTVLWGCSVGETDLTDKMRVDLATYNLIVARESLSYFNLKKINSNTLLMPDPAFTLECAEAVIPYGLCSRPYIGINISPMILSKENIAGITIKNYVHLVERIISETDCNVALIPHVVKQHNDDRVTLRTLYNQITNKERVFIIEDQNCRQLKSVISQCECFVGARTHSTIAAYSTCVPTLVVGYSVKAKGIARDLFGTDDRYVVPVQSLSHQDDLYKVFSWLWNQRSAIRKHLSVTMPHYLERVSETTQILEKGL